MKIELHEKEWEQGAPTVEIVATREEVAALAQGCIQALAGGCGNLSTEVLNVVIELADEPEQDAE